MTPAQLRSQIADTDPTLTLVYAWPASSEAIVADRWGEYLWPSIAEQRGLMLAEVKEMTPRGQLSLF